MTILQRLAGASPTYVEKRGENFLVAAHPKPVTVHRGTVRLLLDARRDFLSAWRASDYRSRTRAVRILGRQIVLVNDPADIKYVMATRHENFERKSPQMRRSLEPLLGDGLFISDGKTWAARRPLVADIVHKTRVPDFGKVMEAATVEMAARWATLPAGTELNALAEMAKLTAAIIARAVFGNDLSAEAAFEVVDGFTRYQRLIDSVNLGYFLGFDEGLPAFRGVRLKREVRRIHTVIDRVVSEHLDGRGDAASMLDLLIRRQEKSPGLGLGRDALRNEAATIFMAGHETTAATLTWAWYLLGSAPWAEARLLAEIRAVCGDRTPTVADVPKLAYATAVIEETLRLYPPVPILARQPKAADRVGEIDVEPAALVLVVPWLLHRSPDLWKRPTRFRPERFLKDQRPIPYSYIPFAIGPRICAGLQFGLTEAVLCLAILAGRFAVRVREGYPVHPTQRLTLRPEGGLPVTVTPR